MQGPPPPGSRPPFQNGQPPQRYGTVGPQEQAEAGAQQAGNMATLQSQLQQVQVKAPVTTPASFHTKQPVQHPHLRTTIPAVVTPGSHQSAPPAQTGQHAVGAPASVPLNVAPATTRYPSAAPNVNLAPVRGPVPAMTRSAHAPPMAQQRPVPGLSQQPPPPYSVVQPTQQPGTPPRQVQVPGRPLPPGAMPPGALSPPPLAVNLATPGKPGTVPTTTGPSVPFGGLPQRPAPPPSFQGTAGGVPHYQPQQASAYAAPPARRNDPRPPMSPVAEMVFETRRGGDHAIPPPAATPLVVRDRGSAGPHFIRSSLNLVPQSPDLYRKLQLPLGFVINPLACGGPKDDPIPVVDLGPCGGPVRCSECRAYVNPYFRFVSGGERMICNFCGAEQPVPANYTCQLDLDGRRRDLAERPELLKGSVDVVATAEYMVRAPMAPTHLFVVEATHTAGQSGATAAACVAVASALSELPDDGRTRVALLSFDCALSFYNLTGGEFSRGKSDDSSHLDNDTIKLEESSPTGASPSSSPYRTLVVADVDDEDMYCPLPAGGTVALTPSTRAALLAVLRTLPDLAAAASPASESAGGAALAAAVAALRGAGGGRVHAFIATLARRGNPSCRPRDTPRALADRDALDNLLPDGEVWAELARRAAEYQIRAEIYFLSSAPYADVASLATFARLTAGSVRMYDFFGTTGTHQQQAYAADVEEVSDDLRWALRRPAGLEAVGRLRVSTGLSIGKCWGAFQRRTPTDLLFPALDGNEALAVSVDVDEKLADRGEVYAQFALLYTRSDGCRLVRVHTLALPITTGRSSAFRGADADALMALTSRRVAAQAPGKPLGACRDAVLAAAVDVLVAYRRHAAQQTDASQLLLPEALQLLPILSLGLTKCPLFRNDAKLDERALWHHRLLTVPPESLVALLYPRLMPLHKLLLEKTGDETGQPSSSHVRLPDALPLSAAYLESDGIYLLENGFEGIIFVSRAVGPDVLVSLLGVPALDAVGPRPVPLPRLDTPMSRAAHAAIAEICRQRARLVRIRVLPAGPMSESSFFAALVEDKAAASGGGSYSDCLRSLHRAINNKLS